MAYPISWHSTLLGHIYISRYSHGLSIYKSLLFNLNISHILLWCNCSDPIYRFPVYPILPFFEIVLQRKFAFSPFSLLTSGRLCKEIFSFSHFLCSHMRCLAKFFEDFAFFFAHRWDAQPRFLIILHFSLPTGETLSQDFFSFSHFLCSHMRCLAKFFEDFAFFFALFHALQQRFFCFLLFLGLIPPV